MRDFIHEAVERTGRYAQHAADYAALGDDRGPAQSIRLLTVCAVIATALRAATAVVFNEYE